MTQNAAKHASDTFCHCLPSFDIEDFLVDVFFSALIICQNKIICKTLWCSG